MKKIIYLILILTLVICSTTVSFATEEATASSGATMQFTGEEIQLSLQDAIEMVLSESPAIELARVNQRAGQGMTRRSFEAYRSAITPITIDVPFGAVQTITRSASRTEVEMADLALSFNREQVPLNFQAEVNHITRAAVEQYFGVVLARENFRISRGDVELSRILYQNTQSRFNSGLASRHDVIMAEFGLSEAIVRSATAETRYTNARMGFNIAFGYDLMQNITLTDTLQEVPLPNISLGEAIEMALENRNEIRGTNFRFRMAELDMANVINSRNYTRFSSRHIQAEATLIGATAGRDNAPKQVEMDVRARYLDMTQRRNEVILARQNVIDTQEAYRLANLQFNAGMITLAETQRALLMTHQVELGLYNALLMYNLAVLDFELATTVGTERVNIM